jgi:predicted metal-dependent hydrolase
MATEILLGSLPVQVVRKNIKNVHLSVHPPTGRVRIAAPHHLSLDAVRAFAIGKLVWIRQQQQKLQEQEREAPREHLERESHYVWGRRHLMTIEEQDAPPGVRLDHNRLVLSVRPDMDAERRGEVLDAWYRVQLREAAAPLLERWEKRLGVRAGRLFVQRMKTRWGSCNPTTGAIRLNTDLAKKPRRCLEYIAVHELVHLLEPTHNARFVEILSQQLPDWTHRRQLLNRLPVRHEDWSY